MKQTILDLGLGQGSMGGEGTVAKNLFVCGLSFSGNEFGGTNFYSHFETLAAQRDTLNKTNLKSLGTCTV